MANNKLNDIEIAIINAFKHTLRESALSDMLNDTNKDHKQDETSHNSQFRWEGIDDSFKLLVSDSPFADAITSAFMAVHSHKYLDHPTFKLSFEKELKQRAVPTSEINRAFESLDKLVKDLEKNPSELDSGWNQNMDELKDITSNADNRKAKPTEPFTGGGLYPENDEYDKGELEGF